MNSVEICIRDVLSRPGGDVFHLAEYTSRLSDESHAEAVLETLVLSEKIIPLLDGWYTRSRALTYRKDTYLSGLLSVLDKTGHDIIAIGGAYSITKAFPETVLKKLVITGHLPKSYGDLWDAPMTVMVRPPYELYHGSPDVCVCTDWLSECTGSISELTILYALQYTMCDTLMRHHIENSKSVQHITRNLSRMPSSLRDGLIDIIKSVKVGDHHVKDMAAVTR